MDVIETMNKLLCVLGLLFTSVLLAEPPERHGLLDTQLYLGAGERQPLVVGFGGSEGGNAWTSDRWQATREDFLEAGFAFLAVGYFGLPNASQQLDRISLDAIHQVIMTHSQKPPIDPDNIILIGGSKGGELVLNLASRYPEYKAVVALVPSHVSFPGLTFNMDHSSWSHLGEEVPFVKATPKIIGPRMTGDIHRVFTLMLEDVDDAHEAVIPVEQINGSVLLVSAQDDEVWPSTLMSDRVIHRLQKHDFQHPHAHWAIDGDHASVLDQFPKILAHLKDQFIFK